jgi:hypothetical protein
LHLQNLLTGEEAKDELKSWFHFSAVPQTQARSSRGMGLQDIAPTSNRQAKQMRWEEARRKFQEKEVDSRRQGTGLKKELRGYEEPIKGF